MKISFYMYMTAGILSILTIAAKVIELNKFQGTWNFTAINSSKQSNPYKALNVKFDLSGVSITRTLLGNDGKDSSSLEKLDFSEKPSERTLANRTRGVCVRYSTIKLSPKKDSIVVTAKYIVDAKNDNFEFTTLETWSLSDNGQRLNLIKIYKFPDKTEVEKSVYDRSND